MRPIEFRNYLKWNKKEKKEILQIWIRSAGSPFVRYARRATAVLARAGIRRATVIERQCGEMSEVSRQSGRGRNLPLSDRWAIPWAYGMFREIIQAVQRTALPDRGIPPVNWNSRDSA